MLEGNKQLIKDVKFAIRSLKDLETVLIAFKKVPISKDDTADIALAVLEDTRSKLELDIKGYEER